MFEAMAHKDEVYPRVCGGTFTYGSLRLVGPFWTVYPRVCGGTVYALPDPKSHAYPRSIPACAGEPETAEWQE